MKTFILFSVLCLSVAVSAEESICYGTTKDGNLENGVKLPGKGENFKSYGMIPELSGRTYVHSKVRKVVIDAYKLLESDQPEKVYKYAETGFKSGGEFSPHKTHQNGLSIDFIVPVLNKQGKSVHLDTNPLNKYGYNIEFSKSGVYEDLKIDFEALGAHIVALHKAAKKNDIAIWRVIFAPDLQALLYATSYGDYIKKNIMIPTKKSWVRHDEHFHIDFDIKCKNNIPVR